MENTTNFQPYRCVLTGGTAEITEKKSRFIATVRRTESEEEAVSFIEEMKKKYWDASHNCSAFVIGRRGQLTRCSDDGEPSGTAGRPMLEVLLGEGICDAAVVVTRYFGGTLLGTGGLVRAYGGEPDGDDALWKPDTHWNGLFGYRPDTVPSGTEGLSPGKCGIYGTGGAGNGGACPGGGTAYKGTDGGNRRAGGVGSG